MGVIEPWDPALSKSMVQMRKPRLGGGAETNEWCLVSQQRYDADGVEPGTLNADPSSRHAGQASKEEARQDPAGQKGPGLSEQWGRAVALGVQG